jgi:hypothetical protein
VHADNLFSVKVGGKTTWIELKHRALARAMRGVGSELQGTILGRAMFSLARSYAALLTSYNPEFVVSNFSRDLQTALINVGDIADRPEGTRRQIVKDALSLKAIRGILSALRGEGTSEYAQWFEEYRHAGGKISFVGYNDVDVIRAQINRAMKSGDIRRALSMAAKLIEDINSAVENGVRLSTYIALRRAGVPQDRAAFVARELGVNFNRKGEWGPAINAMYLFFNASIQGLTRVAQYATTKNGRYVIGSIFAAGMAIAMLNVLLAGDDDDGENAYDKIPDWVKERNLIIMLPGGKANDYIQLPLAWVYNVPFYAGEQVVAVLRGKKKPLATAGNVASAAFDAMNPIGSSSSFAQFVAPTFMDPVVQTLENRNWFGGPIYPQKFDRKKPDSETFFASVPAWAVDLARFLNSSTGGNVGKPGLIDVSPETIQHYLEFMGGGLGKFVLRAWKTGERVVNGDEWLPDQTPFVRRLYGKTTTLSRRREFYEAWNEVDQARYEVNKLRDNKMREESLAAREKNRAELQSYAAMHGAYEALRKYKKQRDAIEQDRTLSDADKRTRRDDIVKQENQRIIQALRIYNKIKKAQDKNGADATLSP